MSNLKPSPIIIGDHIFSGFSIKGQKLNREPIECFRSYQAINIQKDTKYFWNSDKIDVDIKPINLLGYRDGSITSSNKITLEIVNPEGFVLEIDLTGRFNTLGNCFFYEFPNFLVKKGTNVILESDIDIAYFECYCKLIYLDEDVKVAIQAN